MPATTTAPQLDLTIDKAEHLIRKLTDGLVNIKDETGEFLMPLADGTIIDTKGWGGWEWTHGVALTGLYHHAHLSPSPSSASHSRQTALDWFKLQNNLSKGEGAPKNINTMAPFYSLAGFLQDGGFEEKEIWGKWVEEWAEWVMRDLPRTEEGGFQHITYLEVNKDQLWDDTLMMTVIPLAKIGILLDKEEYIEEAKFQFLLHIQYLTDNTTGLWYHGWEFTPTGTSVSGYKDTTSSATGKKVGHNFAKALWARGNCWVTIAIPLFIQLLEEWSLKKGVKTDVMEDPLVKRLVGSYRRQVDGLIGLQNKKTGLWNTLLVDEGSYEESSATAGFAAGIYMGLRMGLIEGEPYLSTANLALAGVIDNIRPDCQLEKVSFGTGMGHDEEHYRKIPITPMPYGPALASLALIEWERLVLEKKK